MDPHTHSSCLTNAGKDECNVLHNGLLVRVKNSAASLFVIAPCSQKFGRELLVRVAHYLSNEGKLVFCNLVLMVGMLKNLSLTSAFLILSSFTSVIVIPKMFLTLLCRNTSSLERREVKAGLCAHRSFPSWKYSCSEV